MSTTQIAPSSMQSSISTIAASTDSKDVFAQLHYVKENAVGEYPGYVQLHAMDKNFLETKQVTVHDMRGKLDTISLDENGFEYFTLPFNSAIDHTSDEEVKAKWYPQIESHLKEKLGAKMVVTFNHIVRNAHHLKDTPMTANYKGPAVRPHLDISSIFGPTVLQDHKDKLKEPVTLKDYLDIKSEASLDANDGTVTVHTVTKAKQHWQILNVWRPLSIVERDAFAVVDAKTVHQEDWIALQLPQKPDDPTAKTNFLCAPGKDKTGGERKHHWCYLSKQMPDECLIFKQYDSSGSTGLPHTAFELPDQDINSPPRQSIETRLFVFY